MIFILWITYIKKVMNKMEEDEKPINCPKCGKFMKITHWTNENSGEQEDHDCSCGYSAKW